AFLVDAAYGLVVFWTNPKRAINQYYALLTIFFGAWLFSQWNLLHVSSSQQADFWIRPVLATTLFIPVAFNAIRLSMKYREYEWGRIFKRSTPLLCIAILACVWCFLPNSIIAVNLPENDVPGGVPEPEFGPGYFFFELYHILFLVYLVHAFVRDTRNARGIWRTELQYLMFGCGVCLAVAVLLGMIIPEIIGDSRTAPLAPVAVILMNIIIAYGIATQRIMGVATVLRRATAYGLLTAYLVLVYQSTAWIVSELVSIWTIPIASLPELLAALVVAFSLAPVHGRLQKFADVLFVRARTIDLGLIVQQASAVTQSISTLDDLLHDFTRIVLSSLGTNHVRILLLQEGRFVQAIPEQEGDDVLTLDANDPLVRVLALHSEPLVMETLRRRRLSPLLEAAVQRMHSLNEVVAIGIRAQNKLSGIMLLGERLSGRIYTAQEEDALSLLSAELGVALDNAKLFTEASNSRLYNDILLENLGNGMIATNMDLGITACNREAHVILRLPDEFVAGASLDQIPPELAEIIRNTLRERKLREELDVPVRMGEKEIIHLRVTSSVFKSHTGDVLGAMVVFQDVTTMKHLQVQNRRSDRLASMGTLSAGMAHEIKNPLVTIKTFTQLLPERYEDEEFRYTFQDLVGKEVKRIDRIVNQLLTFSRPSKPRFEPIDMTRVIADSLSLVGQEMRRNNVEVSTSFQDESCDVLGDADLLSQAFVNFFLNAQESMQEGGTLSVQTLEVDGAHAAVQSNGNSALPSWNASSSLLMLIKIADTGCGIEEDDLLRVFDPFFTTKKSGTGLGLSVAHGIITEQGGMIDVVSEPGRGTEFLIHFPVPKEGVTNE
ncbi:MAG: ATP-binding protein, partial [Kiritimatiellae bacterium]|nr:ATP-binding protein [Kiritimatiellia bacterium]